MIVRDASIGLLCEDVRLAFAPSKALFRSGPSLVGPCGSQEAPQGVGILLGDLDYLDFLQICDVPINC